MAGTRVEGSGPALWCCLPPYPSMLDQPPAMYGDTRVDNVKSGGSNILTGRKDSGLKGEDKLCEESWVLICKPWDDR